MPMEWSPQAVIDREPVPVGVAYEFGREGHGPNHLPWGVATLDAPKVRLELATTPPLLLVAFLHKYQGQVTNAFYCGCWGA